MTLFDLCRLLKRYVAVVIVLPLVCALGCFVYFGVIKTNVTMYSATTRIVVTTHLQDVNGLSNSAARAAMASNKGATVKVSMDSNSMTISIVSTSSNEEEAIRVANEVAEKVCLQSGEFIVTSDEDSFNARVEQASVASASSNRGDSIKYTLVGLLVGLFVSVCIVVIIDMVKRPIKSVESVQNAVELPVLEIVPANDNGERLLANIRFASKMESLKSVCLIPVGEGSVVEAAAELLIAAAKNEGLDACLGIAPIADADLTVLACESLSQSMKAAYAARKADATVLMVRQWTDSMVALESAVAELKLADVNMVGVVFAINSK